MSRFVKVLTLAILFSFGWGTWWGFYSIEKRQVRPPKGESVKILAEKGYFPPAFIASFIKSKRIAIEVIEVDTPLQLLREVLSASQKYDLIQIPSTVAQSFLIDSVFEAIDRDRISRLDSVSVDFRGLGYDPDDKYFVPLSWGLSGFLVNTKKLLKPEDSLSGLLSPPGVVAAETKPALLASPIEIYNLVVKLKPIVKVWLETGNLTDLKKELRSVRPYFQSLTADPNQTVADGKRWVVQAHNGQAAKWVSDESGWRFVLPKERANLWIRMVGVNRTSKNKDRAYQVLNALLEKDTVKDLVLANQMATTLSVLDESSEILPLQRARYIRMVPLSRVELNIANEALEPTWNQLVQEEILGP